MSEFSQPLTANAAEVRVKWPPAVFVNKAEELRSRLKVWHVRDPRVPVKVEPFLELQEMIRWQFRTVVLKIEHGVRPAAGEQFFPNLVPEGDEAEGLAGSAFENLPSEIDQHLTRWLLRDFYEHLADAGTGPAGEYLRLKVERILDAPIYCERPPSGEHEQYLLDKRSRGQGGPYSFVGGRKLDESLLNDLVEAARMLLRSGDAPPATEGVAARDGQPSSIADTRIRPDDQIRLSITEAANLVRVSDRTIREWRANCKLTVLQSDTGQLVFSKSELELLRQARK